MRPTPCSRAAPLIAGRLGGLDAVRLTNRQFSSVTVRRSPREDATSPEVLARRPGNTGGTAGRALLGLWRGQKNKARNSVCHRMR